MICRMLLAHGVTRRLPADDFWDLCPTVGRLPARRPPFYMLRAHPVFAAMSRHHAAIVLFR